MENNSVNVFQLYRPHGECEVIFEWQTGSGGLLATYSTEGNEVAIYNRRGVMVEKITIPGVCSEILWDEDGDFLGILVAGSSTLMLYDANLQKRTNVDLGLRDNLSCLLWSKKPALLAVGTSRGNMAIYNHNTGKRIPVLGKHNKKITCGAWSRDNILALGSEDKNVSISNGEGDTMRIINLRAEPSQIAFSDMKLDERTARDNTISILVGKRTLFLYNLDDPENPVELAFQQKYGNIVKYTWFGDGYILLGFSAGYFIAISTHLKEVGQELFQVVNHRDGLKDIALNRTLELVASCGDNVVKIHDMNNLNETADVVTLHTASGVEKMGWSSDGQLLALATTDGSIHVHLSSLPMVSHVNGPVVAVLSSISIVSVHKFREDDGSSTSINLDTPVEPQLVAVSSRILIIALHNRAWYYDHTESPTQFIREKEYLTNIRSIHVSSQYVSVLYTTGTLQLHTVDGYEPLPGHTNIMFPDTKRGGNEKISGHALTEELLIMSTDLGHIRYFSVSDWTIATEYRHDCSIKDMYCDSSATRVLFVDVKAHIHLYNPVIDTCLVVLDFPGPLRGVVWDLTDRNCFIMYDQSNIYTHVYNKDSVHGTSIVKVGSTKLPPKQIPLLLIGGLLQLETATGQITSLTLTSHQTPATSATNKDLVRILKRQLALQRYAVSYHICETLNDKQYWLLLAESALANLDLDWAIRGYAAVKDAGMVWSLTELVDVEDRNLVSGHSAMLLGSFDVAEDWFLRSKEPEAALVMRRNLLHWERALALAKKFAPSQLPTISCEYAAQLEFAGNHAEALSHFETALTNAEGEQVQTSKAGIARNAIRVGDLPRGLSLISDTQAPINLIKDCAEVLEGTKHLNEAAPLYERCQQWDKAATIYIKLKNWYKVTELLPRVTSRRIHVQLAKAKEAEGKWEEAARAYQQAGESDSLIRIYLEKLNNPHAAVAVVQESGSIEGARMVATHFQKSGDNQSAIKFLVMSECFEEAFQLARRSGLMELYGQLLQNTTRKDDFKSLAMHFEGERNSYLAGRYYYLSGDHGRALRHLMRVAKNNADGMEAISLAVKLVADAQDDVLTKQLISYLTGETDGTPKNTKYLLDLYMIRGMFRDASKTAVLVANEEQMNGNYRAAHSLLYNITLQLRKHNVRIPQDLSSALALLHSYILVRVHARSGEHIIAARLLTRVAESISHFPAHIVSILTSTVIECSKAGLRASAFQHAATLMRPEYRDLIDTKYRKKIEALVRKPGKISIADPENMSPCPVCNEDIPDFDLNCPKCKSWVPFCIASGKHLTTTDLTACPSCDFPAIFSEFKLLLQNENDCPMCSQAITVADLRTLTNLQPYINGDAES